VTDPIKTCTNCGQSQATGDFCEGCGTRLPAAAPATPPPSPYAAPAQYGAPQAGAPQYGAPQPGAYPPPQAQYAPPQYAAPRAPRDDVWGGLGDFTFLRFPTAGLARLAWILAMIWVALSLIVSIWIISDNWGGGISVFLLLKAIAVAAFTLVVVRVGLEAAAALHRIREKKE
jgi:hypothetical protein